jgi:hypothetical protein
MLFVDENRFMLPKATLLIEYLHSATSSVVTESVIVDPDVEATISITDGGVIFVKFVSGR